MVLWSTIRTKEPNLWNKLYNFSPIYNAARRRFTLRHGAFPTSPSQLAFKSIHIPVLPPSKNRAVAARLISIPLNLAEDSQGLVDTM